MSGTNEDILDLGCGKNKTPGAFGVDHFPGQSVDLVFDLDEFPYPLKDNSYDRIIASHIVEHLQDVPRFFSEIHRVARHGARVRLATPHFSNRSAYADPTHRHAFSVRFLDFITGSPTRRLGFFDKAVQTIFEQRFWFEPLPGMPRFARMALSLSFSRVFRILGVEAFANAFPDFYEFYLAFLFPARDIVAELRVIKEDS